MRQYTFAFLTGMTLSGILTSGPVSHAWIRLLPAPECIVSPPALAGEKANVFSGKICSSNPGLFGAYCPFEEHVGMQKSMATAVFVDAVDNDPLSTISAEACSAPINGASVHCGATQQNGVASFTGYSYITISGSALSGGWSSSYADDYGYVDVFISNGSCLIGITVN